MSHPRLAQALALLLLAVAGAVPAAESPVTVSPGDVSKVAVVESRCPTFSWGEVEGATSYELVLYRVGEEGEEARGVLRRSFAGSVDSWTPALDSCLERGGRYAWSVRAVGSEKTSEWSAPSLFEVAAGPSAVEFEAALAVVRQYVGDASLGGSQEESSFAPDEALSTPSAPPEAAAAPAPLAPAAGDSALQVNGAAVVTTATLAGAVAAIDRECPGALGSGSRYTDCGNGAVRDNNTGLYWLKDASCADLAGTDASGTGDWGTAEAAAAALASGTCGLSDGSQAGDWRQPTILEFCSAWTGSTLVPCPSSAAADSLVDSSAGPPTVAAGHPFVGVGSTNYWSATESGAEAWFVGLDAGFVLTDGKAIENFVWPVRAGQ